MAGWLVGDEWVSWLAAGLVGCLAGGLGKLAGCWVCIDWWVGWLAGWSIGRLVGELVGWLVGLLAGGLVSVLAGY